MLSLRADVYEHSTQANGRSPASHDVKIIGHNITTISSDIRTSVQDDMLSDVALGCSGVRARWAFEQFLSRHIAAAAVMLLHVDPHTALMRRGVVTELWKKEVR